MKKIILLIVVFITLLASIIYLTTFPSAENGQAYYIGLSQIISGLFSGVFTVVGVYWTIRDQEKLRQNNEKDTELRMKEQIRLENLPVLKYLSNNDKIRKDGNVEYIDCTHDESNREVQLNIEIKNVGLGLAQNIWFQSIMGVNNNQSRSGRINEIIEPNSSITYTIYYQIPSIDFNKELTILVFYDDLLGNHYIQELNGNVAASTYSSGDEIINNISASVYQNESYKVINNPFEYEIPQEKIDSEKRRIKYEMKNEEFNKISNKHEIDSLVNDFMSNNYRFYELGRKFFNDLDFRAGSAGINDYKVIDDNIYEVLVLSENYIDFKQFIHYGWILRVDLKLNEVSSIERKIIECTLPVKKNKINKFKNVLKKFK